MLRFQSTLKKWKENRQKTISVLRSLKKDFEESHTQKAESELGSAEKSVVAGFFSLGSALLAPVSGGLSLVALGGSSVFGIGSFVEKRDADKERDRQKYIIREINRVIEEDQINTNNLNGISEKLVYLENKLFEYQIDDILVRLEETTKASIDINIRDIRSHDLGKLEYNTSKMVSIPGLDLSRQAASLNAALTSAKQVTRCTAMTKEVVRGTRTIEQIVSTAKSVNDFSKAAKQAAIATLQTGQSMTKSTVAFASVAKGANDLVNTAGAVTSVTKCTKATIDIATASGQSLSLAKYVTDAEKAGTLIQTIKRSDTTIRTVKNVKQTSNTVKTVTQVAMDSDKALRTTRITSSATRVTKASQTVTKAASISKVGLAINAISIPFDLYNLTVALDNRYKSSDEVKRIKKLADELEEEMNSIAQKINAEFEIIHKLHKQLYKVYEDHRIQKLYDYLVEMHGKLEFDLPSRD